MNRQIVHVERVGRRLTLWGFVHLDAGDVIASGQAGCRRMAPSVLTVMRVVMTVMGGLRKR